MQAARRGPGRRATSRLRQPGDPGCQLQCRSWRRGRRQAPVNHGIEYRYKGTSTWRVTVTRALQRLASARPEDRDYGRCCSRAAERRTRPGPATRRHQNVKRRRKVASGLGCPFSSDRADRPNFLFRSGLVRWRRAVSWLSGKRSGWAGTCLAQPRQRT